MKDEKETREKLLASARQEFLEKGYMQASLRSICKNTGVTTGALYFFFQDKEDLFTQLVEPTLQKLREYIRQHFQAEQEFCFDFVKAGAGIEIVDHVVDHKKGVFFHGFSPFFGTVVAVF